MKHNLFSIVLSILLFASVFFALTKFCSCSSDHEQQRLEEHGIEQIKGSNGSIYKIVKIGKHKYIENSLSCGTVLIHYEDCECKSKVEFDPRYIPNSK